MRIGIDCRMAGTGEGIARYVEELVRHLGMIDHVNEYVLVFHEGANFQFSISNFQRAVVKSGYYSFSEQTKLIFELKRLKLDLMHFPSFNVPIFYPGKFVVTIHDMIHHHFPGKKKSRFFHRAAYRLVISAAVRRAAKVIAVSDTTAKDVGKYFGIPPAKVAIIYEGVDERFYEKPDPEKISATLLKYNITKPYILFVGVWRQYKNLPRLAQAFDILKRQYGAAVQLVLAGKIDAFYPEIKRDVMSVPSRDDIRALGFVSDDDLRSLYGGASIFVLPSLIEGFGLIGAEAQASGAPVAASDIPVLHEVLSGAAVFFDPQDTEDMAKKMRELIGNESKIELLKEQGRENAKKFNWTEAAKKTLEIYKTI